MALSFGNNSPRGTVGLDLDGVYMAAVRTSGDRVVTAASEELLPGVITDGEVTDIDALAHALGAFFREHNLPKNVRLGVSNQQIVVRHLDLPAIADEQERAAAVRFQAAEAIAMPLEEAILDYQTIGETVTPEGAPRTRIVLVAARQTMIARLVEAVKRAGLRPEGIDLNAFALVRALAPSLPADRTARVYCHLGGVINLAIASGSACLFTRPLSTSRDDDGDGAAISLAEEIRLSIDFYMAQPDAPPVGGILLSGPGARQEGLAAQLGALIGLPASVAEPLGTLDGAGLDDGEDPYRHTVAAGLALGAAA